MRPARPAHGSYTGRCPYSVAANFLLFVTNWLRNSGKMEGYPDDNWTVEIWTVKTGLGLPLGLGFLLGLDLELGLGLGFELVFRLGLGLGLVMTVQFMTFQILTVHIKTGNHGRFSKQFPLFGPCLLSSNGLMDQDAIWYEVGLSAGDIVLDDAYR